MATAYTYRSFIPPNRTPVELPGNPDIDYSSAAALSQQCSLYSAHQNDTPTIQGTSLPSSDNAIEPADNKPALPPKPFQGPPIYREPPCPPVQDEVNHPDICINSASAGSHQRSNENTQFSHSPHSSERPDRLGSRTHAWVQEHKSSGKLVGEKLSSLQRKLRSFLSQSSSKEPMELEKPSTSIEEKPRPEVCDDNWNLQSTFEGTQRSRPLGAPRFSMNPPSTSDQNLNYISASSFGSNSVALSIPQPVNHAHHYKSFQPDRHPFAAPTNVSEHEDSTDPDQMRDTCNKFFAREQRISWTNYLNPRNSYSNNIKSSYDYDKLVPKEVIGRPSQEKKPELSANREAIYGGVTPFPSFAKALDISSKQTEQASSQAAEGSYYAKRVQSFSEEGNAQAVSSQEVKVPNDEIEAPSTDPLPTSTTDCGDATDLYKSSSESGRGTMHSSMHGSKSVVSPHSSGVSAASNLDTSIDSDHSASGTIWGQQNRSCQDKRFPEEFQVNKVRHIYETPNTSGACRQSVEKEGQDDATSESLSVTPPLPPLSPAPSPPGSGENSPKLSSRAKYKLSLSASALNTCYGKSSDHQQKICDMSLPKPPSSKKPGTRRTTNINQTTCRHRSGKSSQYTKASSSGHRLGITHSNCATRKSNSSPPSRHHSRSQLAYPCYLDNADPELTSTTTGLDMESLLDDDDDYSSDLSATASTMEPSEVSMIRKQLEGLETMYSEILRLLGVKNSCSINTIASSLDISRHSHRKMHGSLSSLTAAALSAVETIVSWIKEGFQKKGEPKNAELASKRLQRLESHVVTLARSVAHLSSEMRTQHVLVQELENMRQDVTWVQERMRLMQLAQGCHPNSGGRKSHQLSMHRDWDNFHKEVLELLNPSRAKKLTKFFGDEPPLIRQFLKRLGYEKYAANFENEKIGIKELPYLTEERLQKMGIPMGPRIRILQEAHSCSSQNQYKVYIV